MRFRRGAIVIAVSASTAVMPAAAHAAASSPTPSDTINVGTHPYAIAMATGLGEAFVADDSSVSVVDTSTRRQVATIPTGVHDQTSIALVRDDTAAYVGAFHSQDLTVINTRTRTVAHRVHVGAGAVDITTADSAAGQRAYVAQLPQHRIAAIRTSDDTVLGYTNLPHGPQTLATAPGSRDLWAGSSYSGQVWDLNTADARVRRTIDVTSSGPVQSIAFTANGQQAWVAGLGGVSVVDVSSGKVTRFLPAAQLFPATSDLDIGAVALDATSTRAYVVNSTFPDNPAPGQVRTIDAKNYRLGTLLTTGTEPVSLTVDPRNQVAYTTNYAANTLTVLDIAAG